MRVFTVSENNFTPNGLFFATRAVLKIGRYYSDIPHTSFSWGIITHVNRLDQSRERKYLMDYNYRYSSDPGAASHDKNQIKIKSPPLFRITPPPPLPPPRAGFTFIGALLHRDFLCFLHFLGT